MGAAATPLVVVTGPDEGLIERAETALAGLARVALLPPAGAERAALLSAATVLIVPAWGLGDDELPLLGTVRLVQSLWAGADRIPVARLRAACPGVTVATGAGPNAPQVAEHALALYLACTRRLVPRDQALRAGIWEQWADARRVAGSRVAVVGTGHVGSRILRALAALDATCIGVNRSGRAVAGAAGMTLPALRQQLASLDGVILALPLARSTVGLVDTAWLAAMRPDGILVNVARGRLVDAAALHRHLLENPSFFAGLDVWWTYPKPGAPWVDPHGFAALPNVVMSPHHAFQAPGVRAAMQAGAVANVRRFLETGEVGNRYVD